MNLFYSPTLATRLSIGQSTGMVKGELETEPRRLTLHSESRRPRRRSDRC